MDGLLDAGVDVGEDLFAEAVDFGRGRQEAQNLLEEALLAEAGQRGGKVHVVDPAELAELHVVEGAQLRVFHELLVHYGGEDLG